MTYSGIRSGGRLWPRVGLALLLACSAWLAVWASPGANVSGQTSPRFFPETGYSISNDAFWNYFERRGGLRTFGYPTSREFSLEGFRVQFFQRQVMQLTGDGRVQLLNLLDSAVLPYTKMNGSVFPGVDQTIINSGPNGSDPAYGEKAVAFVRTQALDSWNGRPVNFGNTAVSLVRYSDAFPNNEGPAELIPVINVLEITGLPTSAPTMDPNNNNFVYQRFQRLILQYDATTNTTQALLLADYLKALMTGQNLPGDLEEQARGSRYYRQYSRGRDRHIARPDALMNSDLTNAFEREDRPLPSIDLIPTAKVEINPPSPVVGSTFTVTVTGTDDIGLRSVSWNAENSGVSELDVVHDADCAGATNCIRIWNAVSRVPGALNIRAQSIDSTGQTSDVARTTSSVANTLRGALEKPSNDSKVGGSNVLITGWAADKSEGHGTGIQAIHVYLDGEQGQGFFLGAAEYGLAREDIQRDFLGGEDRYKNVGWRLQWDTTKIASGDHVLNAYALSAVTGRWEKFTARVTVVARPFGDDPIIKVLEPQENGILQGQVQLIRGWAADRNAPTGTGVSRVEVWLNGQRNVPGAVKLGDAVYGVNHGSPEIELGDERFKNSGFTQEWNIGLFRRGTYTVWVYAFSSFTDNFSVKSFQVTIQ